MTNTAMDTLGGSCRPGPVACVRPKPACPRPAWTRPAADARRDAGAPPASSNRRWAASGASARSGAMTFDFGVGDRFSRPASALDHAVQYLVARHLCRLRMAVGTQPRRRLRQAVSMAASAGLRSLAGLPSHRRDPISTPSTMPPMGACVRYRDLVLAGAFPAARRQAWRSLAEIVRDGLPASCGSIAGRLHGQRRAAGHDAPVGGPRQPARASHRVDAGVPMNQRSS